MVPEETTRSDEHLPPPTAAPDVPSLPAPFVPVRLVGQGAFGQVWEANDEKHRRRVAVKVARRPTPVEAADSYLREARTLAQLDHPHIVPVYDSGLTRDRRGYLVSKFVSGGSLAQRLAAGPLPPDLAAHLIVPLADGLQHAHECGVIHRDVKPQNVLFDGAGRPLLIDFGLALWSGEPDHACCGTPAYMSPEQAGGTVPTGQSDVFSLGVVLYELLAGRRPFAGANLSALGDNILHAPLVPVREHNPNVPRALSEVCTRALARPLSERFGSANALAEALRRFLAGPWNEATEGRRTDARTPPADLPAWQLRVVAGPDEGAVVPLRATRVTFGRSRGYDLALTDKRVSRIPQELVWDAVARGYVWDPDFGPYVGQRLNGQAVRGRVCLRPGDVFRVGLTELRLEQVSPAPPGATA
jgi:hypothetical protein